MDRWKFALQLELRTGDHCSNAHIHQGWFLESKSAMRTDCGNDRTDTRGPDKFLLGWCDGGRQYLQPRDLGRESGRCQTLAYGWSEYSARMGVPWPWRTWLYDHQRGWPD